MLAIEFRFIYATYAEILGLKLLGMFSGVDSGDGSIYSWGRGKFGRLGTGSEADELFPVRVKFDIPHGSEERKLKFVGVAAGAYHSLALAGLICFPIDFNLLSLSLFFSVKLMFVQRKTVLHRWL